MKNAILLFIFLLAFNFANAQNDETYWTLNLSNQFFAHNNVNTNYLVNDLSLYETVYNSTNGFYTFQPSLQKYKGKFFTEFGLRNTGFSEKTIWVYDNFSFSNTSTTLSVRQTSANITAFYAKNMRILGKKSGLYLGGDIFFNTNFIRSDFLDQTNERNGHNLSKTTLGTGFNITPRYQYYFSNRVYAELALLIKILSYSVGFQSTSFSNKPYNNTTSTSFSFYNYTSPQISIGLKI